MSQEDTQRWMKEVMSKIIDNLGPDIDEARYESTEPADSVMSSQFYVRLKFKNRSKKKTEEDQEISLMLKRCAQNAEIRRMFCIDSQFYNEIVFYRTCVQPGDNVPRCFHVDYRPPIDSVIALENVSERGYRPCTFTRDVPLEYTLEAVRELARFHGKGYVMKELQRNKFFDMAAGFRKIRTEGMPGDNVFTIFIGQTSMRAVDYLRARGHDRDFCDKAEVLLSNAMEKVVVEALQPREPLCTLCHGDFTVGNTLFNTETDGQCRAMLIDFACVICATPALDLSTYLCLYSNDLRKNKFHEIMRAYHDTLRECLTDAGVWHAEKYSYEAFLEDFRRNCLYGFCIASFFMPIWLGQFTKARDVRDMFETGVLVSAQMCRQAGGDEISEILAETLLRLGDIGCLRHVL